MKIDAGLLATDMAQVATRARELEDAGFDGCFTFEGPHEPFMRLALAAEHSKLEIGTGLAIAFARTPMTVANLAHDLQHFSGGRFWLGLGSQIKPHIERRYAMKWSKPVTRMKEFVRALRAIWACWNENEKLDFRGEFYTHTLMPPIFNPGPATGGAADLPRRRWSEDDRSCRRGGGRHAAAPISYGALAEGSHDALTPARARDVAEDARGFRPLRPGDHRHGQERRGT